VVKEIQVIGSDRPALVDDEDYSWANKYEWFISEDGYVCRLCQPNEIGLADDDVIEMGTEVYCRRLGLSLSEFCMPRQRLKR
jgi:hypothetical protein